MDIKEKYYFCYSHNLSSFLRIKGLKYICKGINEQNGKKFWLYEQSSALSDGLRKYTEQSKAIKAL